MLISALRQIRRFQKARHWNNRVVWRTGGLIRTRALLIVSVAFVDCASQDLHPLKDEGEHVLERLTAFPRALHSWEAASSSRIGIVAQES